MNNFFLLSYLFILLPGCSYKEINAKKITAERFVLMDSSGSVRGEISSYEGGLAFLHLSDPDGEKSKVCS
jgi:hypothetical protein